MATDEINEEALLGDDGLDLYGDGEHFERRDSLVADTKTILSNGDINSTLTSGIEPTMDHHIKMENEDDLFNAVITDRSSSATTVSTTANMISLSGVGINSTDLLTSEGSGHRSPVDTTRLGHTYGMITGSGTSLPTQRRFSCYVGNLTWWTTDEDLVNSLLSIGVTDILDVKFYENRQNGQSKGFALVSFDTDASVRRCLERISTQRLHEQPLVALPYTKTSLSQLEAATRKPTERTGNNPPANNPPTTNKMTGFGMSEANKPGGPVFIGTFRIGMAPGAAPPSAPSAPPPVMAPATVMVHHSAPMSGQPTAMIVRAPPPGAIIVSAPPPGPSPANYQSSMRPPTTIMGHPPPMGGRMSGHATGMMPPPGSHVNPNFYPSLAHQGGGMGYDSASSAAALNMTEAEFEEIMNRNRTVSSSAISRAVSDASAGDFASAIETLVTAISLIRQSKVAHDDRCKILISSLQDTLRGIEAKSFGSSGGGGGGSVTSSSRRSPKVDSRRSRSRERVKRRHRSRSRSRSRGGAGSFNDDYSPRRRRY